ncbi:MAG TPA: hypothetical protein VMD30_07775 [Tepidisphaeraceae bacterium]|nr:hypothetical protein [Tepidisphaeraceae bacterium]
MSAREIYDATIRQLPPIERLRLASLILDELAASNGAGLDMGDDWSDEDIADLIAFSARRAAASVPFTDEHA